MDKLSRSFSHALGVTPTGWTHSRGGSSDDSLAVLCIVTRGQISMLEVPYREYQASQNPAQAVPEVFQDLGGEANYPDCQLQRHDE